ncbi:hypothetical protein CMI37_09565 [Candidatus Pacearchaeota archaeon]|nr:hypothetical protein [Candidatus Pacearchaeota archaeon]
MWRFAIYGAFGYAVSEMSESETTTTTAETTATEAETTTATAGTVATQTDTTQATTTAATAASAVDVDKVARHAAAAALESKATADAAAAEQARRAAALEQQTQRATTAEAEAAQLRGQLRDQKVLGLLPGLRKPEQFLSLFTDGVELTDGKLTEEQAEAISELRKEHGYLFDEARATATGNTPGSSAGHRTAEGNWSPEDQSLFRDVGTKPGAARKHKIFTESNAGSLLFPMAN